MEKQDVEEYGVEEYDMEQPKSLTTAQKARIERTLQRIRGGLSRFRSDQPLEPSHLFKPEAHDERRSR